MQRLVVVMESDIVMRETIVEMINFLGYTALGASDEHQVYDLVRNLDVKIVLLGSRVDRIVRSELCASIKRHSHGVTVIAVAGYPAAVINTGDPIDDYLYKPFSIMELKRVLRPLRD